MELAPIALFVYNRPEHTKKTIEALKNNKLASESELYIFSDAAKNEQNIQPVCEVREYIKTISGFKKIKIIERETNFGLSKSIKDGVNYIFQNYNCIIVLEDDLISSHLFLTFMNHALQKYENCEKVYSITGYSHLDDKKMKDVEDAYFLSIISTWSWATWKNKWKPSDDNILTFFTQLKNNRKQRLKFDYDGTYPYYMILKKRIEGIISSWGIDWYMNVFCDSGLTLYPKETLIMNLGFDGSGTNFKNVCKNLMKEKIEDISLNNFFFPDKIEESKKNRNLVGNCLLKNNNPNLKWCFVKLRNYIFKLFN